MLSGIKSMFGKAKNVEDNVIEEKFDHSKVMDGNIGQCPFMNKKKNAENKEVKENPEQKCPYKGNKNTQEAELSDSEDEKPRGGCPFMGGSEKKKNPGLAVNNEGYDEPFVSKFKYYLSSSKIDLSNKLGKKVMPNSRQIFDKYPIYLKHTLFYNGEDYKKVRNMEVCSRFMAYEELRQKGNKYFNKGKYYLALDFYERAMSVYRWLDYSEPENSIVVPNNNNNNQINDNESTESEEKIQIENDLANDFSKEYEDLRGKYKEFFITYGDDNVKYENGQDLTEVADIDMRKSLLVQLYLNMASTYMKLNHFSIAEQITKDGLELCQGKVSQLFFRNAQSKALKKNATLKELDEAKEFVSAAIQLKKTEKIFTSANINILKMLNLHDVDECFNKLKDIISEKIAVLEKKDKQTYNKIYKRAKEINNIQKRMIQEGKTPRENQDEKTLYQTTEMKTLDRMANKYIKVVEFYTESKDQQQKVLAKNQLQHILEIIFEINKIINVELKEQSDELGNVQTEKIQHRIKSIKTSYCEDIYNNGKYNFTMLEWAIKEIVKEEHEEEKNKKQMEEKLRKEENGGEAQVSGFKQILSKDNIASKLSYLLVIIPFAFLVFNNFVI